MDNQQIVPSPDDLLELRQVVQQRIFGNTRLAEIRRWCRKGRRMLRTSEPIVLRSIKDGRNRILTTRAWCDVFQYACDTEMRKAFVVVKASTRASRRLSAILG